eukprot:Skav225474  [mRNA]  locus=scaffold3604:42116:42316:+ [translate_table: standard]
MLQVVMATCTFDLNDSLQCELSIGNSIGSSNELRCSIQIGRSVGARQSLLCASYTLICQGQSGHKG